MFEATTEGTSAVETSGEAHVAGPNDPGDPTCAPAHNDVIGLRVTGVTTNTASTMSVTTLRRCRIQCVSIPENLGQFWFITSLKVIDKELMLGGQATSSTGTPSAGVFGSEFASYAQCADLLEGMELDNNSQITIIATNTSGATQEFRFAARVTPIAELTSPDGNCAPAHNAVMGLRVTGVTTATSITATVTSVRRCRIQCVSVPAQLGPIWQITSLKVIDTEMMIAGQATATTGTASIGVFASELSAYGLCATALKGLELQNNSPITIIATNTSGATAEFRIIFRVQPF